MGYSSQVTNLDAVSDFTGLIHEVYAGEVKPNVAAESPTSQLFQSLDRGQYRIDGEKLVGSADLLFGGGGTHTSGQLPDHEAHDAVEWQATPARRYVRRAIDNLVELRGASGPGTFGDLGTRIFDQLWDAFSRMQIRGAIGNATGTICKVSSRTSSTVFVVKDGYGHASTDPLMHLEPGMCIAWIDVDDSNNEAGAARISSIAISTNTITVDSGTTWEPGNNLAANDLIVFATTPNISTDYFETEYGLCYNGLMTIVDPDEDASTVFNIAEGTYPRWKPLREASSTFDHFEVTEHWRKLRARSTAPVTPQSHICVANGAVVAELARTLEGYQQQSNLGRTFEGGYTSVRVSGMDFIEDDFQIHDVLYTLCTETLFNVDLGGDADYFAEDGSMYNRQADFDGKEWFVREYGNYVCDRRNRHAALTGISMTNVSATDFTPVPR